ncbi:hypothetical protein BOO22_16450 [Vibrio cidicii]|uniref:NAD/NADP transhydrogenase subunit beta n=1 Tax=Vibrio cidicii TaxID=1763883 RepID=UPI0018C30F51|nr:NAD/NADP transhydrogenase subunit beta [Vibrio cidicii]MBG0761002.1 hypothetical protein [Vibrio cidicii]
MALLFDSACIAIGEQTLYQGFTWQDLELPQWCDDIYFTGNVRRAIAHQSPSLVHRLIDLIDHHAVHFALVPAEAPLCLLLPEIKERQSVAEVLKAVQQKLPISTEHERTLFCYPYGSASFLVALKRIAQLANSPYGCWVVALDSSEVFCSGIEHQSFEETKTDSLLLARTVDTGTGLAFSPVQIDLHSQAYASGSDSVMPSLASLCKQELTDLCLPLKGEESEQWQNHLYRFSPWITQQTRYHFNQLNSGELGAGVGLLNALLLYEQQKQAPNAHFHALQLDCDPLGMAAGVLYCWRSEE